MFPRFPNIAQGREYGQNVGCEKSDPFVVAEEDESSGNRTSRGGNILGGEVSRRETRKSVRTYCGRSKSSMTDTG